MTVLAFTVPGEPVAKGRPRFTRSGFAYPDKKTGFVSRDDFYQWARDSYAVIQTGEARLYGNIILVKGVVK